MNLTLAAIGFGEPGVLLVLAAVGVAALALLLRDAALERTLELAIGPRWPALRGTPAAATPALRGGLFAASAALAVIALARPAWGREQALGVARSVDCVIALDVSRSMLARDVLPSRLERAHELLHRLADRIGTDRIGLVGFAGEARLLVPLTRDMESLRELTIEATPDAVARGGTDLGAALDAGLAALEGGGAADAAARAIVLVSDGEDLGGHGLAAARRCAERGVTVHAVGVGTTLGGKIPAAESGARGAPPLYVQRGGQDVISSLDPRGLRAIAAAAGGAYVDGNAGGAALLELVDALRATRTEAGALQRGAPRLVYQWVLLAAWVLWLFELAWSERNAR